TLDQSLIGIDKGEIRKVELSGADARITMHFESQMTSCTKNADGVVVEGDPVTERKVTDVWTFERNVKSRDPNWRLVSTGSTD
ncbi:MAG: Tim44/TimA family putative adaptor protein, partial [Alphaproteobacteria bacterium]